MKRPKCPNSSCVSQTESGNGGDAGRIRRKGFFRRREDGRKIQRFMCMACRRSFSTATFSPAYRQRKRRPNKLVLRLLASKVSQNRAAKLTNLNVKTIARKLRYWGMIGKSHMAAYDRHDLRHVQFDEMQSSIHTKCKPVSIPAVVEARSQRILAIGVASMPAQHPLIEKSLAKYGSRPDERPQVIASVLAQVKPLLGKDAQVTTDMAPHYPDIIRAVLPGIAHVAVKGRKPRSNGQDELKQGGYDPIFSFNHTAAMVRDGAGRMVRKTWGNSKRADRLHDHLALYAYYHNTVLLPARKKKSAQ